MKSTEGVESTIQKGTNTAASSEQVANKDLRGFISPSCCTRRALFTSEKASFKFDKDLDELEVLIHLKSSSVVKLGDLLLLICGELEETVVLWNLEKHLTNALGLAMMQ